MTAPAHADVSGPGAYSWTDRQDAHGTTPADTLTSSQVVGALPMTGGGDELSIASDSSASPALLARFRPPAGHEFQQGVTYQVAGYPIEPTASTGWGLVERDGRTCGKTDSQLFEGYAPAAALVGSLHVSELVRDSNGAITQFAATYQLNCQVVGQSGLEGSIAMNATQPAAAVPAAPAAPGPVTGLTALNDGPDSGGVNATTLSWHNPTTSWGDTEVDMVQDTTGAPLPDVLGARATLWYEGRETSHRDPQVDFMDSRTYRVVPRGSTGRLGPASYYTVMGTRMSVDDDNPVVTIGQTAVFTGRISQSVAYTDPAEVMNGPGLVGHALVLCEQSATHYVDGECHPVARTTTGSGGHFRISLTPTENSIYTLRVPADAHLVGNTTWLLHALVAPQTDLAAPEASPGARAFVARGATIHFTTSSARRGARGVVLLQRYDGHRWHTVATKRLPAHGGKHRLRIPFRDRTPGRHVYRLVKPGDAHHVAGVSKLVHVTVR